ncbi:MAG: VCBS repeat-containing protein, partial [Acidobacteriota bacterium]|nr:VCBS repeat-containing protein [Acidobacteriota bacterium]
RATAEDRWQFTGFELYKLGALQSRVDLFDEIALTAGVATRFPPFGEGKNQGFVYHGVATADVNLDGLLDVATSGVERNRLFINRGDGTFDDLSDESLIGYAPVGAGALFLDFDNDGDSDLFMAAVGRQILFENRFIPDGKVRFLDISEQARVDRDAVGFSAVAADVNSDGYPDIYVASYNRYGTVMPNSWVQATNGTPNLLLINQQDGTFAEESVAWGVADDRWSYAAGFVDIDEDGDQDLYVTNDFGRNGMFRNEGDRFVDVAEEMGVVDPGFGMGVSFGDYDNDGDLDLHVTNMSSTAGKRILSRLYPEEHEIRVQLTKQAIGNSLYRNDGEGHFEDVTDELGGLAGGWAFGGGFVDFDNDGREDVYSPNGFISGKSMKDT